MSGSPEFDATQPAIPRRYEIWLGDEKDSFAADRASAAAFGALVPTIPAAAVENRKCLLRAVRYLAQERGIRQFLDLGCGMPHTPDVDDIARRVADDSRVLYVDTDPMVGVHMRALRADPPRVDYVEADLRQPGAILTHHDLQATLDLTKPVAVLMSAVLHFVPDTDHPADLIRQYSAALAPGSYLFLTHGTLDGLPEAQRAVLAGREHEPDRYCPRSQDQIAALLKGWDVLDPGIVPTVRWPSTPEPNGRETLSDADAMCYAALAVRR